MIQDVAEKQGNINAELVCDALAASDRRIMGPAYMKPGMGDGGACHPRDNIALRYMSAQLGLGYDLFDSVMRSREVQAENMAHRLIELSKQDSAPGHFKPDLPIVIVGKAYKPLVPYTDGSASMLVGHYVEELGGTLYYHDHSTGDSVPEDIGAAVYLLAHDPEVTYGTQLDTVKDFMSTRHTTGADEAFTISDTMPENMLKAGSVIVDPWRKVQVSNPDIKVIHYGNTRGTV